MKAIFLFALVTLAATVVSGQQDAPSNPRRVQSTGRPIVEQINQEDKHIVPKKNAFAPMMVGPSPGTSFLNFMTDGCELVVMATVRSRTPKLDQRQASIVTTWRRWSRRS